MRTIATGLAKALIAAMKFAPMSADQIAGEAMRGPKYRRGFHHVQREPGGLRAVWADDRPGWSPESIRRMNARNGVGSSKIRKAHAK